jgi:hypothetical protein
MNASGCDPKFCMTAEREKGDKIERKAGEVPRKEEGR